MIVTILLFRASLFLLVLSILVFVHELGHFLVAKKLGVKVDEFAFGFPVTRALFSFKRGETKYSFYPVLIGGFVKLFGEDEAGGGKMGSVKDAALQATGEDLKRAFFTRPVWQRASIVFAGVVMNLLLAIVINSYLFAVPGMPAQSDYVVVQAVVRGSPAEKAGLKPQDAILSTSGKKITDQQQFITFTKEHLGEQIVLQVRNQDEKIRTIIVTPRKNYPKDQGPMGVAISKQIMKRYSWYQAPIVGTVESFKYTWLTVQSLGDMAYKAITEKHVPKGIAGPITILYITGESAKSGINGVLWIMAVISINLAVFNVLPIPALDGGRLFFILVEAVTRKKVNPKIEGYIHAAGMIVLLTFMAFIVIHEVTRLINHQPLIDLP